SPRYRRPAAAAREPGSFACCACICTSCASACGYLHPFTLRCDVASISGLVKGEARPVVGLGVAVGFEAARLVERAGGGIAGQDPQSKFGEVSRTRRFDGGVDERAPEPGTPRRGLDVDRRDLANRGGS